MRLSTSTMRIIIIFILAILFVNSASAAAPALHSDSETASAGYFRLSWSENGSGDFILQEAQDPTFTQARLLYQGPDSASLISGRPNGDYYYRIRYADNSDTTAAWSNVVKVVVEHHPLSRAILFFTLGACIFIATLIVVISGNRKHQG